MDNATLKDVADVLRHCAARSHITEDCQALLGAANVVDGYALKLDSVRQQWAQYRAYLVTKYPPKPGEQWAFTCPEHLAIEELLK